jgi:hypothetical protein
MAKKIGDDARWLIGILFTAAALVFGSNLYDRFFEERQLAFDVRTSVPRAGVALLRIVNASPKTCGPASMEFTANATLRSGKFRKVHAGDEVMVNGRLAQIDVAKLAARNGRVDIDFQYEGLVDETLKFTPADREVGCGEVGYSLVAFKPQGHEGISSVWLVGAVLAAVIVAVIAAAYFGMDPFR